MLDRCGLIAADTGAAFGAMEERGTTGDDLLNGLAVLPPEAAFPDIKHAPAKIQQFTPYPPGRAQYCR